MKRDKGKSTQEDRDQSEGIGAEKNERSRRENEREAKIEMAEGKKKTNAARGGWQESTSFPPGVSAKISRVAV